MNSRGAVFAILILLISLPVGLKAQTATTGSIAGTVSDISGAVAPNVEIHLYSGDTGTEVRSVKTDDNGHFVIPLLSTGSYRLEAEKAGFQRVVIDQVQVIVTQTTRADFTIKVGSQTQKVEVQSITPAISTENSTTGATLGANEIENLPLVNRNYYELLTLTPGTTSDINQGGVALGRGVTDIQVSGQRTAAINYQIQGVNVNDYEQPTSDKIPLPNPDFLQELNVSTSLYDASEARSGGLVNATIRSGQNQLHGVVFYYIENDKLNANDVFLNAQGKSRPELKSNQFGGGIGGKVPFGGLHFFTGYQGWRERNGYVGGVSTAIPVLPTIRTAATLGAAFGVLPSRVDPVAVNILNLQSDRFGGPFLIPTVPGTVGSVAPFAASAAARFTSDQGTFRLDRQWTNDTISGVFFIDEWNTALPLGGGFAPSQVDLYKNLFITPSWTHVFGPQSTNQSRLGYNRVVHIINTGGFFSTGEVGMNSPNATLFPGLPQFIITGFLTVGGSDPSTSRVQNVYSLSDDFTHLYKSHSLRFGFGLNQYRFNRAAASFGIGSFTVGSRTDPVTGASLTAMQAFLEGIPSSVRLARPGSFGISGTLMYRVTDYDFYVQDDWAVSRRLQVNIGLRVDALEMPSDRLKDAISVFSIPNYVNGGVGFELPQDFSQGGVTGTPGVSNCGVNDCRSWELGPRIGLAYKLTSSGKTVIRSGYGIYYDRVSQQPTLQASGGVPFGSASGITTNQVGLANAFSVVPIPNPIILTQRPQFTSLKPDFCRGGDCFQFPNGWAAPNPLALNFHPPRVQMWNLTLGQQLPHNWALEVGYVGTRGTSLVYRRNPDQPLVATPANPITVFGQTITTNTVNNEWLRVPYPGLDPGRFRITDNSANSVYHALQISATKRAAPLYVNVAYTWSKSIDTSSQGGNHIDRLVRIGGGEELGLEGPISDQNNLNAARGVSDFDRTHHLTVSNILDIPTPGFARNSAIGRGFLGGWTFQGVAVFQSGTPYTVFDSSGGAAFGAASQGFTMSTANPATSGSIHVSTNPNQYLNPSEFAKAGLAPGGGAGDTTFGTLGRNIFRSPFQQNWDLSLQKSFPISESKRIEFRTAFFNTWNHPIFDVPDNGNSNVQNINAALIAQGKPQTNFGVSHSTVTEPRTIQFSLRFKF